MAHAREQRARPHQARQLCEGCQQAQVVLGGAGVPELQLPQARQVDQAWREGLDPGPLVLPATSGRAARGRPLWAGGRAAGGELRCQSQGSMQAPCGTRAGARQAGQGAPAQLAQGAVRASAGWQAVCDSSTSGHHRLSRRRCDPSTRPCRRAGERRRRAHLFPPSWLSPSTRRVSPVRRTMACAQGALRRL